MEPRLIFVEGLPGTGKSTMAQFLALQFEANGYKARWVYEGDVTHPIRTISVGEYATKAKIAQCIENWISFVETWKDEDTIHIIDATFLQCTVIPLYLGGVSERKIFDTVESILDVTLPLRPSAVYLFTSNTREQQHRVVATRGLWFGDLLTDYVSKSPYARHQSSTGFDLWIQFCETYVEMLSRIFSTIDLKTVSIDVSDNNWLMYQNAVTRAFKLSSPKRIAVPTGYLQQFAGAYLNQYCKMGTPFHIEVEQGRLVIIDMLPQWSRIYLIPRDSFSFYAQAFPFIFTFERNAAGEVIRMTSNVDRTFRFIFGSSFEKVNCDGGTTS